MWAACGNALIPMPQQKKCPRSKSTEAENWRKENCQSILDGLKSTQDFRGKYFCRIFHSVKNVQI